MYALEPMQPDIKPIDPDKHYERVIGNVNDIRDEDEEIRSKEKTAEENPILLSYFPALCQISVSSLQPEEWSDQEIIDELVKGLPHEFMHELLYVMGDSGDLGGDIGMGFDISRQYDYFLHDVIEERGLHIYARS